MSNEAEDRMFDELVRRSGVAKGFRPRSDEEIEAMLDALGGQEVPETRLARMLRKVRGEEPVRWEIVTTPTTSSADALEETRELVEMFRGKGEEIPPELEEKLRELEREAAEDAENDEDEDAG